MNYHLICFALLLIAAAKVNAERENLLDREDDDENKNDLPAQELRQNFPLPYPLVRFQEDEIDGQGEFPYGNYGLNSEFSDDDNMALQFNRKSSDADYDLEDEENELNSPGNNGNGRLYDAAAEDYLDDFDNMALFNDKNLRLSEAEEEIDDADDAMLALGRSANDNKNDEAADDNLANDENIFLGRQVKPLDTPLDNSVGTARAENPILDLKDEHGNYVIVSRSSGKKRANYYTATNEPTNPSLSPSLAPSMSSSLSSSTTSAEKRKRAEERRQDLIIRRLEKEQKRLRKEFRKRLEEGIANLNQENRRQLSMQRQEYRRRRDQAVKRAERLREQAKLDRYRKYISYLKRYNQRTIWRQRMRRRRWVRRLRRKIRRNYRRRVMRRWRAGVRRRRRARRRRNARIRRRNRWLRRRRRRIRRNRRLRRARRRNRRVIRRRRRG